MNNPITVQEYEFNINIDTLFGGVFETNQVLSDVELNEYISELKNRIVNHIELHFDLTTE